MLLVPLFDERLALYGRRDHAWILGDSDDQQRRRWTAASMLGISREKAARSSAGHRHSLRRSSVLPVGDRRTASKDELPSSILLDVYGAVDDHSCSAESGC